MTPWFAAGAGFVIAAALALNSPHTVLTYRPNTQRCSVCKSPAPSRESLASAKPGVQLRPVRPAHKQAAAGQPGGTAAGSPVTGAAVGFRVVWRKDGKFSAIVTIPALAARHGWSLRFEIPGVQITDVWGAQWQPASDGHGGLASMLVRQPGQPGEPGGSGGGGSGGQGQPGAEGQGQPAGQEPGTHGQSGAAGDHGWWGSQEARFLVIAEGNPRTPVGCVLNGVSCHFG